MRRFASRSSRTVLQLWCVVLATGCAGDPSEGVSGSGASDTADTAAGTDSGQTSSDATGGTGGTTSEGTDSSSGSSGGGSTGGTTGEEPVDWDAQFDHVYPQDHVVQLDINPPAGKWGELLDAWDQARTKNYYASAMSFDSEELAIVGFRLKGWSSLASGSGLGGGPNYGNSHPGGKFPLKIDFDKFGGPRFHDVNKYNLSNNWADLSYMRERLSNRMYLAMGVPAARTAYVRVSVDGNDNGLYTATQQIDRTFLEEHFGHDNGNGNLYKAVFTDTDIGSLAWQGSSKSDYVSNTTCATGYSECGLVQKTNEDDPLENDYADLIGFLDVLNNTPGSEFETAIQQVFEVDAFLRLSAVSVVMSSFDGYLGMGHNYYLYNRPDTGKFMMLPWDHNESYAGHPCGQNAINFNVHQPVCNQRGHDFVLANRIFAVPAFKAQYLAYVQEFVDDHFTDDQHQLWIGEFNTLIRSEIATDPNYIANVSIFDRSLGYDAPTGQNIGGHGGTEYNLLYFVTNRRNAVLPQL